MKVLASEKKQNTYNQSFQIHFGGSHNEKKIKIEKSLQQKKFQIFLKRSIDIVVSLLLIISLLPLLAMVALLIKLTSRGPLLYINERVGYKGKNFSCFKFRSMVTDHSVKITDYEVALAC